MSNPAHHETPTQPARLDADLKVLSGNKRRWAELPVDEKIRLLEALVGRTDRVSHRWVDVAVQGKQLPRDSPWVGDESLGEEVKAIVALKPGHEATADDIITYCKSRLAAYKYPRSVEFRDALPKGPTGKILKRELKG